MNKLIPFLLLLLETVQGQTPIRFAFVIDTHLGAPPVAGTPALINNRPDCYCS